MNLENITSVILEKENVMKKIIDIYEGIIPEHTFYKLKEAMYNYEVEITD